MWQNGRSRLTIELCSHLMLQNRDLYGEALQSNPASQQPFIDESHIAQGDDSLHPRRLRDYAA